MSGAVIEDEKILRQEIVESEKAQADLLKWKLIATAGVVSFGLTNGGANGTLLICAVPFVCAYIDLISLHIMIRIITIGASLRSSGSKYERYIFALRTRPDKTPFVFEAVALHGSSILFNIGVVVSGFVLDVDYRPFLSAGVLGIVFTVVILWLYSVRLKRVSEFRAGVADEPQRSEK